MFCPNCGKDCGSANFCIKCGTDLRRGAAAPDTWSVGEPCPYCGGTRLEGDNCAFCGAQLMENMPTERETWQNIPLGTYECIYGYLKLKQDKMVIKNKDTPECVIPYASIKAVEYHKPRLLSFGWLTVRWEENAHTPCPKTSLYAMRDETSAVYSDWDKMFFFRLYHAIKDYIDTK